MPLEMKSRINGIVSKMEEFKTYFGLKLAHFTLRHTDNLATKLQKFDLNAAQGYELAMLTVLTLEEEHSDEKFEIFFKNVL